MTLEKLRPLGRNPRRHTERNIATIASGLQEVGAARSVVIDEEGVILAGNGTIEAAKKAGLSKLQVVDADGETVIAVRRSGLTPEQKERLALIDNRSSDLGEYDAGVLAALDDEGLRLKDLFTGHELQTIYDQDTSFLDTLLDSSGPLEGASHDASAGQPVGTPASSGEGRDWSTIGGVAASTPQSTPSSANASPETGSNAPVAATQPQLVTLQVVLPAPRRDAIMAELNRVKEEQKFETAGRALYHLVLGGD